MMKPANPTNNCFQRNQPEETLIYMGVICVGDHKVKNLVIFQI